MWMIRTEGEVQSLGGEVPDDVGGISSPKRNKTFFSVCTTEGIRDTLVWGSETTLFDL